MIQNFKISSKRTTYQELTIQYYYIPIRLGTKALKLTRIDNSAIYFVYLNWKSIFVYNIHGEIFQT